MEDMHSTNINNQSVQKNEGVLPTERCSLPQLE